MRLEECVRTEPENVHDADEQPQSRDVDVPSRDEQVRGDGRPDDGKEHQIPGHGSDEKDAVLEYPRPMATSAARATQQSTNCFGPMVLLPHDGMKIRDVSFSGGRVGVTSNGLCNLVAFPAVAVNGRTAWCYHCRKTFGRDKSVGRER